MGVSFCERVAETRFLMCFLPSRPGFGLSCFSCFPLPDRTGLSCCASLPDRTGLSCCASLPDRTGLSCFLPFQALAWRNKSFGNGLEFVWGARNSVCARARVCVCLGACVRACVCASVLACVRTYVHACVRVCARVRLFACVCARAFVCLRACVRAHACARVCVCSWARACSLAGCPCACTRAAPAVGCLTGTGLYSRHWGCASGTGAATRHGRRRVRHARVGVAHQDVQELQGEGESPASPPSSRQRACPGVRRRV